MRCLVYSIGLVAFVSQALSSAAGNVVEVIQLQESEAAPSAQGPGNQEGEVVPVAGDPTQEKTGRANADQTIDVIGGEDPGADSPPIPKDVPAAASSAKSLDRKPLTGFGRELWRGLDREPIVRVLGSGAPELFVQLDTDQVTVAQVGWLQEVGDFLQSALGEKVGTIHLMISRGESSIGLQERPVFDTRPQADTEYQAGVDDSRGLHAAAAEYLGNHASVVHRVLLSFPEISEHRIGLEGSDAALDSPVDHLGSGLFEVDTWEDFVLVGLGVGASILLQVDTKPRSFYRLQGDTEWMSEAEGSGPDDSGFRQANAGKILETCLGTRAPDNAAKELIRTLDNLARYRVLGSIEVMPMGGELWQVEFLLGAPTMQIEPVDPMRSYPRDSFNVQLNWGSAPAPVEGVKAPVLPSLAYLAWQPTGQEHFELLPTYNGSFRFPGQSIPDGARLRLGIQAPGGVGKLVGLALQSRLHGAARAEFVAPSRKEAVVGENLDDAPGE